MAHNSRVRSDAAWTIGPVVTSGEWLTIDTNLTKAVNGDCGGTYNPTSNIVIGGAGLWIAGIVNPLNGTGSQIATSVSSKKYLLHNDSDHVTLSPGHSGRTRTITVNMDAGVFPPGWDLQIGPYSAPITTAIGANMIAQLRVHNGATFVSVTFRFVVGSSHGPPAFLPQFRVFALDANGVRTPLLTNGNQGYTPFAPAPANNTAWYAGGAIQSFTYTLDANVVIDTSKYSYWVEVVEESGSGAAAGNVYIDATASFSGIADLRPQ